MPDRINHNTSAFGRGCHTLYAAKKQWVVAYYEVAASLYGFRHNISSDIQT